MIAGKALREEQFFAVHHRHPHHPVGQLQGQFQGVGEAGPQVRFDDQPVHHRLDGVPLVLVDGGQLLQLHHLAVEADAAVALAAQPFQELCMLAFAIHHHRGQDGDAAARGQPHNLVRHLGHAQGRDGPPALVTVRGAHPGEQHPEVIVDFGGGGHGGAGVPGGGALFDGDGRGQPFDILHVRLVHEFQELPGVGRQGLHVAALPFGIKDVEGQGGFARTAHPGDHDEPVAGQFQVDILEVVFPGAPDNDLVDGHRCLSSDSRTGMVRSWFCWQSRVPAAGRLALSAWVCDPVFS